MITQDPTRTFAPGTLLPRLWVFSVAATEEDVEFWICAPDDVVAMAKIRDRHIIRKLRGDYRTRNIRVLPMRPASASDLD